jgi:hypothetical protein
LVRDRIEESVTEKVEERLDILFAEDDEDIIDEKPDSEAGLSYPLRELKTIVLSIDWEITDEVMKNFVDQVVILKDKFKNDKIILVFLQLLGSIGEYIRVNLGKSHPDAFNLLSSSFNNLDKIVKTKDLGELEKKKLLSIELNHYKKLKEKLVAAKAPTRTNKPTESEEKNEEVITKQEDIVATLIELKQFIRSELKTIKEELDGLKRALARIT